MSNVRRNFLAQISEEKSWGLENTRFGVSSWAVLGTFLLMAKGTLNV